MIIKFERVIDMQKKNIIPIIAIVLAFVLICVSLCCIFVSVGREFDLYNKIFGESVNAQTFDCLLSAWDVSVSEIGGYISL